MTVFDVLVNVDVDLGLTEKLVEIMDDDELPMSMLFEFSHLLNMINLKLRLAVEFIDNHNDNLAVGHDKILDEFLCCE